MSAITALNLTKALTASGSLNMAQAGVSGTDFTTLTLSPVGIDNNGVAKYRNVAAADISTAEVASFSSNVKGEKVASRLVAQLPYNVTVNGVSVTKFVTAEVRLTSHSANTAVQRRAALQLAIFMAGQNLIADITTGASPY